MSGGSYNYAYREVEQFADCLERQQTYDRDWIEPSAATVAKRLAFAALLRKVSAAMKAIEWVDSGDASHPHDTEAIRAVTDGVMADHRSV